jgi:AcrR family transcriptional regulator
VLDVENAPALSRREREKIQLKQSILDATREIAANEGWQAVTTRRVAEKIEYSLPTLYEYFDNKAALIAEINREGFRELLRLMQATHQRAISPTQAIYDMGQAYCNFAWQHHELYEVMHGWSGVILQPETYTSEAQAVLAEAQMALETWAKSEDIDTTHAKDAVHILWASMYGIASLALVKQIVGGKKYAAQLAHRAIKNLLDSWKTNNKL